jgi:hypothetical protein
MNNESKLRIDECGSCPYSAPLICCAPEETRKEIGCDWNLSKIWRK